jgi:hypothetical protein
MTRSSAFEAPSWWTSLKHGGMLIAPARIPEFLPLDCPRLAPHLADRLRRDVLRVREGETRHVGAFLDTVLEEVVGLNHGGWTKGSEVEPRWSRKVVTGEVVKPRRVWRPTDDFVFPVFVADVTMAGGRYGEEGRLGVGRGKRPVSRVTEWLRRSGERLALLTNARQWRLIHAGPDYDAWCEWDTDLWFEEGEPGPQVSALRILLGEAALLPPKPGEPPKLLAAIQASRRVQAELSAALGERVRLAVEKLIQESGAVLAAIDRPGEGRVSRRDIYIAATRLIMRCVVVLFAEARDLLPRENVIYHQCYGIQGLREQLARLAGGRAERLRYVHGAWPRLLSLFRLIHQGSPHQALPIPRYGGGLFAPGARGSSDPVLRALAAFEDPANTPTDAAIDQILELLCVSKVKVRQGRSSAWVPSPVDFSDLSSEYIGILYEGLLDFELHRAPEDDAIVFLRLGDEPALPLSRLEQEMAPRRLAELIGKLKKSTKKLAAEEETDSSEETAEEDSAREVDGEESEAGEAGDDLAEEEIPPADSTEADAEEGGESQPPGEIPPASPAGPLQPWDLSRELKERAEIWAVKAVKEAKLVPYPRSDADPQVRQRWEEEVSRKAQSLYRLVLPGQWYLVRWGGTRKGAGTFYTRPQLAVPTAWRTLEPLCYEVSGVGCREDAQCPDHLAANQNQNLTPDTRHLTPKPPEAILALKVCDPAMGSGSFLVAALRFLTDALVTSLNHHKRFGPGPERTVCKLADGLPLEHPSQETLPVPLEHPEFEERLRARLKRHVVERCIYGVDIDPLAVELARLALWVETMDRSLPFGFLDHKLRCGNSLVGCWFDRFQDYPVMAFKRDDAGDKNHDRFVHHYREHTAQRGRNKGQAQRSGDVWTQRWRELKDDVIKPEMRHWIEARLEGVFPFMRDGYTAQGIHNEALAAFQELHDLPVHEAERREQIYKEKIAHNPALERLREAFDTWCAIWFWPGDRLDLIPTPKNLHDPPTPARAVMANVRDEYRFFHWEIEFPDVFTGSGSGFDAVIGNPPWEIQKPSSKEFFSNLDPLYRAYGKQEALRRQRDLFEHDASAEHGWLSYCARFKSFSGWNKFTASPFGDGADDGDRFSFSRSSTENQTLHEVWQNQRAGRKGYADPEHPFRHQGSADINTYKMFCETAHALLREGGLLGLLVPSGLYTDKGSTDLRKLFLNRNQWEWLFGFENREGIFDIHRSFKFNPIIVRKGGRTDAIRTAFMHRSLEDWQEAERHVLSYPRDRVDQFSPRSSAILEIRSTRDLEVLEKIYRNSVLLGDDGPEGWGIRYATEFHMTNDSKLFPPRPQWEAKGYRACEYGMWLKGKWQPYDGPQSILKRPRDLVLSPDGTAGIKLSEIEDIALPLYEGRMIGQFDFSEKGWVSGKGRSAVWREIPWEKKVIEPQFLMALSEYYRPTDIESISGGVAGAKLGFMDVTSATNQRTMIITLITDAPCGNKVPVLMAGDFASSTLVCCVLNSFAYDYQLRSRLGGITLNYFIVEETGIPNRSTVGGNLDETLSASALQLCAVGKAFAKAWCGYSPTAMQRRWRQLWAITPHERLRLRCILDAVVTELYGLDFDDLAWILNDCDHPAHPLRSDDFTRSLNPKGFWRVDKEKDPELRHTVLTLVAFHDLKALIDDMGGNRDLAIAAFCGHSSTLGDASLDESRHPTPATRHLSPEGWMLPDKVRLADYGLGHDERAREPQPVAARLGPRFLPWQLEQTPEESWEECERHAERLEKLLGVKREEKADQESTPGPAKEPTDLFGNPLPTDLFGNPIEPRRGRRKR